MDVNSNLMRELIGARIKNKKSDEGVIVDFIEKAQHKYILIQFDFMQDTEIPKKFVYPDVVGKYIFFIEDRNINLSDSTEKKQIEEIIKERKIRSLLHVTRIENLESILEKGILPREDIPDSALTNDSSRQEGKLDCSCLSIERPNSKIFGYRRYNNAEYEEFVCLRIKPEILLDNNIKYYCYYNAANNSISQALYKNELTSAKDFNNMFNDEIKVWSPIKGPIEETRKEYHKPYHTTSIQAEILYKGIIDRDCIIGVDFEKEESLLKNEELLKRFNKSGYVRRFINF